MDKEQQIKDPREKLSSIDTSIREELVKIGNLKTKIATGYRHRDKEKYINERNEVQANLTKLKNEQESIRNQLSELEAAV